jgi:hypothetical protein
VSVPVSVLIPTLDEEVNLPECLSSVAWADEVFVVDSFSNDRTTTIARDSGAQVVQHAFESYSRQKNWALDNLPFRNEWVLIVDADERVTPELRCEIETTLATGACAGYYLNRRFIFLGVWIRHAACSGTGSVATTTARCMNTSCSTGGSATCATICCTSIDADSKRSSPATIAIPVLRPVRG